MQRNHKPLLDVSDTQPPTPISDAVVNVYNYA